MERIQGAGRESDMMGGRNKRRQITPLAAKTMLDKSASDSSIRP